MDNYREQAPFPAQGLYDPRFEHEKLWNWCGCKYEGETDRSVVDNALKIVETLEHRAGKDAEGKPVTVSASCCKSRTRIFPRLHKGIEYSNRRQAGIWYWYVLLPTDQGKVRKGNENL